MKETTVSGHHRGERRTCDHASTLQRLAAPGNQGCRAPDWNVLRINEPIVAVAYGMEGGQWERNVLIYGMSGGTLTSRDLEMKVAAGDTHLGGEKQNCRPLYAGSSAKNRGTDQTGKHRAIHRPRPQCECAKNSLSSSTRATMEINPLVDDSDFTLSLSKARFEVQETIEISAVSRHSVNAPNAPCHLLHKRLSLINDNDFILSLFKARFEELNMNYFRFSIALISHVRTPCCSESIHPSIHLSYSLTL